MHGLLIIGNTNDLQMLYEAYKYQQNSKKSWVPRVLLGPGSLVPGSTVYTYPLVWDVLGGTLLIKASLGDILSLSKACGLRASLSVLTYWCWVHSKDNWSSL